LMSVQMRE